MKDIIKNISGIEELSTDTTFDELGFDSLDLAETMMQAEDKFGIQIPDDGIEEIDTVQDAIDLVESLRKEGI